ncbi:MAG: GNAT family N-acetyltransferase [Flavobacteriaceae bacterium]|nr:GNAT family N-acetyltransferase [Muriicola sp.]MBT8290580.1 GNAT family N-acetyltransferase [Muriicola sp.]NNK35777.1 GNAT family N-acetyltransferase [Eudoraea sp.]NNL38674.1 GNAT family N-acetyltransferase [Flavobacteriaceae bacterium]
MALQIIPYRPELAAEFRDMNLAWLKQYFYVEPKDRELLNNAEEEIIDKGGAIFFAKYDNCIAGCFSLIPYNNESLELGKMAVKKEFQGKKIGHDLLAFAIQHTREQGKESLVLYSNTILTPAIHLYKKFGFKTIEMENPPPYARSNIKMLLKV